MSGRQRAFTLLTILLLALLVTPVLLVAQGHGGEAAASGHGDSGHEDSTTLWKWINFAVLAGIGGYFAVKKGAPYFQGKTAEIRANMDEAARLKLEADNRYREMEARLARLEDEIARMREDSSAAASREAARVQEQTREQIAKIQSAGQRDLAAAARAARQQVRAFAAAEAVRLAEMKVKQRLDGPADQALLEQFVVEMESARRSRKE